MTLLHGTGKRFSKFTLIVQKGHKICQAKVTKPQSPTEAVCALGIAPASSSNMIAAPRCSIGRGFQTLLMPLGKSISSVLRNFSVAQYKVFV